MKKNKWLIILVSVLICVGIFAVPFVSKLVKSNYDDGTVVLNTQGGTSDGKNVSYEELFDIIPEKAGYAFQGWFSDADCTSPVSSYESISKSSNLGDAQVFAAWEALSFDINYNTNNGSLEGGSPSSYTIESPAVTLPTPTKSGNADNYEFLGWYDNAEFYGNPVTEVPQGSYGNKEFYAKWSPYDISYSLSGGSLSENAPLYYDGTSDVQLTSPTRPGYAFEGWYSKSTMQSKDLVSVIEAGSARDKHFYAKWSLKTYNVTYDLGMGSVSGNPSTITIADDITLKTPTRDGYDFTGWTLYEGDSSDGVDVASLKNISSDVRVEAGWKPTVYTIEYRDADDGHGNPATYTITSDTIVLSEAERAGYRFVNWVDATNAIVTQIASGSKGNKVLYALWTAINYEITYVLDGGTNAGMNALTYNVESGLFLQNATRDGYVFTGWYKSLEPLSEKITSLPIIGEEPASVTLYAKFLYEHKITYISGAGAINQNRTSFTVADAFDLSAASRDGYDFVNWNTNSDGSGVTYTEIALNTDTDLTLYAIWDLISYSISYFSDGSPVTGTPSVYSVEDNVVLASSLTKTGYILSGWYEVATPTVVFTSFSGKTGNLELHAKWDYESYSITYHVDGGTNVNNPTSYNISEGFDFQEAAKSGYKFIGWYTEAGGQGGRVNSIAAGTTGDIELYAYFELNYTITYHINGGENGNNPSVYTVLDSVVFADATKAGNKFYGWYSDAAFSNKITSIDTSSPKNIEVYALFSPIFSITYNLDGGENGSNPASYTALEETITLAAASRKGAVFAGWVDAQSNVVTAINKGSSGDIALTATWNFTSFSITYNLDGGQNSASNPGTYTYQYSYDLEPAAKKDNQFYGWYLDNQFSEKITSLPPSGEPRNLTLYAKFVSVSSIYYVTYTETYGAANSNPQSYLNGENAPLSAIERSGYTFKHWSLPATPDTAVSNLSGFTGNITLAAQWTPIKYSITYDYNGGTGSTTPNEYTVEEEIALPTYGVKDHYVFVAWHDSEELDSPISKIDIGTIGNKTFYAEWTLKEYKITYILSESETKTEYYTYSETTDFELSQGSRDASEFISWHTDEQYSSEAVTKIVAGESGDKVFYAKWKMQMFSITYVLNGGTNFDDSIDEYSSAMAITLDEPTREGYVFVGWYTVNAQNMAVSRLVSEKIYAVGYSYDMGKAVTAQNYYSEMATISYPITAKPAGNGGNIIFYAKWSSDEFTITYELNGGINNSSNIRLYDKDFASVPLYDPTYTGYTFVGWYAENSFENRVVSLPYNGEYKNITLYARFDQNYPIDYMIDTSNTSLVGDSRTNYYESMGEFTLPDASRNGYEFTGWYLSASFDGERIQTVNLSFMQNNSSNGKLALYPRLLRRYEVRYNLNMGSNDKTNNEGKPNPEYYTSDTNFTLLDAEREGHIFKGWYLTNDSTGTRVTVIDGSVMQGSTLNLYAIFLPKINLEYETNGGGADHGNPVYFTPEDNIALNDPVKTGYRFSGWYRDASFKTDKITYLNKDVQNITKLYAKWETIVYTITYKYNGSVVDTDNPSEYTVESEKIVLLPSNINYYTFVAWVDAGTSEEISEIHNMTGDITLIATYVPIEYSITYNLVVPSLFNPENNNPAKFSCEDVFAFNDANVAGATFEGWFTSESYVTRVTGIAEGTTGDRTYFAKWTYTEYSIAYDLSVGGVSVQGETRDTYTIMDSITLPNAVKANYTFIGWYLDSDVQYENKITVISGPRIGDITLVPRFSLTYYITYYLGADSSAVNASSNPSSYTEASEAIILAAPSRPYYTFLGWYSDDSLQTEVETIATGTTGDIDLYASWTPIEYSITYYNVENLSLGENVAVFTVENSQSLFDIARPGYTFNGWFSASSGGTKVTSIAKGTHENVSVYARWTRDTYSISYNLNGGSENNVNNAVSYNVESADITLHAPLWDGYTFNGWEDDSSETIVSSIPTGSTGDKSFTARWTATEYFITYENVFDADNSSNSDKYTIEQSLDLASPTRTHYVFDGWYVYPTFAGNRVTKIENSTGDLILYAKWNAVKYAISYVIESGATNHLSNPSFYTVEDNFVLNAPTKSGHNFLGWFTDEGYNNPITVLGNGDSGEKTIYARFAQAYAITYVLDGGKNNEQNPLAYTSLDNVILQSPTKENHKFLEWYTESEFANEITEIPLGSTGIKTFYAYFVRVYSISYETYGGTHTNPTERKSGEQVVLTDAVKSNFLFLGWYDNNDFKGEPYNSINENVNSNTTLYALWGNWQGMMTYGQYPQSQVTDSKLIYNLEMGIQNDTIGIGSDGYYAFEGSRYKAVVPTESANGYEAGSTYFFKVEPIKWKMISYDNSSKQVTLIADMTLDIRLYNSVVFVGDTPVVWENSELRTWLENDFYSGAFVLGEQNRLVDMPRSESTNPVYQGISSGSAVTSAVSILAIEEALKAEYGFSTDRNILDDARRSKASDYALASGAVVDSDGYANWWLYTKGMNYYSASYVGSDGRVYANGVSLTLGGLGVRPVIVVNLGSGTP